MLTPQDARERRTGPVSNGCLAEPSREVAGARCRNRMNGTDFSGRAERDGGARYPLLAGSTKMEAQDNTC
jgi:hypothetical protein